MRPFESNKLPQFTFSAYFCLLNDFRRYKVTCTSTASGQRLYLNLCCGLVALDGSIPSELALATTITGFTFYNNGLTGSVPSQLGAMSKLTGNFMLGMNDLTGSIPSEIGMLTKMTQIFRLNGNQFCDDIPSEVAALSTGVTTLWDITTGNDLGTPCCK